LINDALDGRHACYLAYSRPANVLYLVNDSGAGFVLGGAGALSNSQCTVNTASSYVNGGGNSLTLTLSLNFATAFAGNRVIYLAARDTVEANNTGWQALGSWSVR
jgi:hypothetical protein